MSILRFAFLLLLLLVGGCASAESRAMAQRVELEALATTLAGTMTSEAQAELDPTYFAVRLVGYPIWTEREDGPWLYIEQALCQRAEAPYRQRVYRLSVGADGSFLSEVFLLPEPTKFVAGWRTPEVFATIGPDDLELREGCTVVLERTPSGFVGSTVGKGCGSTRGGASYATSEVTLTRDQVTSWDRGFNAEDEQVWGATEGPYIFDRIHDGMPEE